MRSLRVTNAFSPEQALGIGCCHPTTFFADADRNNFVLVFIDGIEDGSSGKKGNFVLAAAASEQNADLDFLHHGKQLAISYYCQDTRTRFEPLQLIGVRVLCLSIINFGNLST